MGHEVYFDAVETIEPLSQCKYGRSVVVVHAAALLGILHPLARRPSLDGLVAKSEKKWLTVSVAAYSVFIIFAVWPLIFGNLALELM